MVMNTDRFDTQKLSALTNMQMGPTILQKDLSDNGLPVFSAGNQEHLWGYTNKSVKAFPNGTLVVSARGTIGVPKLPQLDSFTCTQTTIAIQTTEELDVRYLYYFLQSVNWDDVVSGVAIPMLTISKLGEIDIKKPPIEIQRRLVSTLDALVPKVRLIKSRLEKIPAILKKLRQSVLIAAFKGDLTQDWREHSRKVENWNVLKTNALFTYVTSGSRGWAKYYAENGALFIRITNLNHNSIYLDLRNRKYVDLPAKAEGRRTRVQSNDVLISITADVGMVGLVPEGLEEAYINQHIALARPNQNVNPEYLAWYLSAPSAQSQFKELQRGATKVGLGLKDIKSINVDLPSLDEQTEIVKRVRELFELIDSQESKYRNAMARIDKIEQSILAKAFRGESL